MKENDTKKTKREPTEEEIKFGMRLVQIRENRKLTQTKAVKKMNELAEKENLEKIGVNTLGVYEAGRFPRINKLKTIKAYYNVSYDYLFRVTEYENYDTNEQAKKNKKAINDITTILVNLSKEK